jgi:Arc/MetJ family transcription regulator
MATIVARSGLEVNFTFVGHTAYSAEDSLPQDKHSSWAYTPLLEYHSQKLYNTAIFMVHTKDTAMKTTVVINGELLNEAMKASHAKTKRETIEAGLRELVRRKNLEALREELGTFDLEISLEELERLRNDQ